MCNNVSAPVTDSPEDREISRLTEEFIHTVHHPRVKLGHVHDLGKIRVVLQRQRSFTSTGVSLKKAKTLGLQICSDWRNISWIIEMSKKYGPRFSSNNTYVLKKWRETKNWK